MERMYCTLAELIDDLQLRGVASEEQAMRFVRAASQFIEGEIGQFLPSVETRRYEGDGSDLLLVHPLLEVSQIINGGMALSSGGYWLEPPGRMWRNGPYGMIAGNWWSTERQSVQISGKWGLYEEKTALMVSLTMNAGDGTVSVTNGSLLSPGMILQIEDEYLAVTGSGSWSNSGATLASGCAESDEELSLSDGTKVAAGETIRIDYEMMRVIEVQGNKALVRRGWNESRIASHLAAAAVMAMRSYQVNRGVGGTMPAAHTAAVVYRLIPPEDVNYLCRQIAALMIKKAQTGYVGRSGNDDLGTGFWINEFPKNQIDAVKAHYFWGGR